MRIIVAGAGEVGFHIAQHMALEDKEVIVIDRNRDALKRVAEQLDVQTILGSGSSPRVLAAAGIAAAELFLAVTDSDEVNLVACFFADALSPGITKLARIRDEDYSRFNPDLLKRTLKISLRHRRLRIVGPVDASHFGVLHVPRAAGDLSGHRVDGPGILAKIADPAAAAGGDAFPGKNSAGCKCSCID